MSFLSFSLDLDDDPSLEGVDVSASISPATKSLSDGDSVGDATALPLLLLFALSFVLVLVGFSRSLRTKSNNAARHM